MAKAIKHIKAGLLNIEVIGNVPEEKIGARGRAAKGRPTSAAQAFYNLKCSWRELELMIAANFTHRDMVITFTFDDNHLPHSKAEAANLFQKFVRKLRAARRKRGQDVLYILAPEGFHEKRSNGFLMEDGELEDRRFHLHVVLNNTGPGDLDEIRSLWQFGGYIRSERLDVHYFQELAKYMTKEAREFGRPKPGERTWRASRNLKKYEVDYIEIPSDSVTLSPPYGAVDYTQFSEANPYGYADCIGARYLMYPTKERPVYSYTEGRRKERPPI